MNSKMHSSRGAAQSIVSVLRRFSLRPMSSKRCTKDVLLALLGHMMMGLNQNYSGISNICVSSQMV